MSTVRARLAIALAALAASAALAACGGGDDGTSASDGGATTSPASAPASTATTGDASTSEEGSTTEDGGADESGSPESRIAPDAAVTAGLRRLKGVAAAVAAAGGGHDARDAVEKVWQPIEGTVKRNEPDLYLDVEDSFELLSDGDATDAKRGAQRLGSAVDAYLAKHPG
jgi:hypothetical protein